MDKNAKSITVRLDVEITGAIRKHVSGISRAMFIRLAVAEKLERDYGVQLSEEATRDSRGRRSDLEDATVAVLEQMRQQARRANAARWKNHR